MPLRTVFIYIFLWLLAACAVPGASGFQDYRASYDKAREAATQVIEVYDQYDKANKRRRLTATRFEPDDAHVLVPTALSPLSLKIKEGFVAATVYNEVLARYLDNNTFSLQSDDRARLNAASNSIGALTGAPALGNQLSAVIGASTSLVNLSLARSDRDEFVRSIRENAHIVDDFLRVVRDDTKSMYQTASLATVSVNGDLDKLKDFRTMLAAWVLLIDQTRADLATLRAQVEAGTGGQSSLALLAESAERIDRYATQIESARLAWSAAF